MLWLLLVGIIATLMGGLAGFPALMATGIVTAIVALTAFKCPSRFLLAAFWIWLETILLYLLFASQEHALSILGLPLPAFVMLAGIWLAPILFWPLGFALSFRKWTDKEQ